MDGKTRTLNTAIVRRAGNCHTFASAARSGSIRRRCGLGISGTASPGAFLDGVNVASLALMAVVTAQLGRAAIVDVPTALLGLAGAILLLRFKTNSTWLVLGGAAAGIAATRSGCDRDWSLGLDLSARPRRSKARIMQTSARRPVFDSRSAVDVDS